MFLSCVFLLLKGFKAQKFALEGVTNLPPVPVRLKQQVRLVQMELKVLDHGSKDCLLKDH